MQTANCKSKNRERGLPIRNPKSAIRIGMTLIELLVVIVILTTLVAGVLPLVSPNNEGRKIQEASRGLQTYFMMAQAEAARLGRPVGVGFIESAAGSGVALEAFQLQVPPPYPGQSTASRVRVFQVPTSAGGKMSYAGAQNDGGNEGTSFRDRYYGYPLYRVQFLDRPVSAGTDANAFSELFPTNMLRLGDVLDIEGFEFLIVDHPIESGYSPTQTQQPGYLPPNNHVYCIWMNSNGQVFPLSTVDANNKIDNAGANRPYLVMRQPANNDRIGVSSTSPYQFPTGAAMDLESSGVEVTEGIRTVPKLDAGTTGLRQLGIMFSPTGGIDSVWFNGSEINDAARIFLLLGKVENGNPDAANYVFSARQGTSSEISDEELAERRKAVNWLNLDSRWMMINANSGKFNVVENASFDPRTIKYRYPSNAQLAKMDQIEAAHALAHDHGD
jgi:type II secretory pathway pseudopilin PulG